MRARMRARVRKQLPKRAQRSYARFGPSRTPSLVKFPSGTRGPQGPRTLGRVSLGSRSGRGPTWRGPSGPHLRWAAPHEGRLYRGFVGVRGVTTVRVLLHKVGKGSNDGSSLEPAKRRGRRGRRGRQIGSFFFAGRARGDAERFPTLRGLYMSGNREGKRENMFF